jgi:hypothetical protein
MKIELPYGSYREGIAQLEKRIKKTPIGQWIQFEIQDSGELRVLIQKLGTSTLEFRGGQGPGGIYWELSREKIAFSHKPFRSEAIKQIEEAVRTLGGAFNLSSG